MTGCFKTHLTHDVRGFDKKQVEVRRLALHSAKAILAKRRADTERLEALLWRAFG